MSVRVGRERSKESLGIGVKGRGGGEMSKVERTDLRGGGGGVERTEGYFLGVDKDQKCL